MRFFSLRLGRRLGRERRHRRTKVKPSWSPSAVLRSRNIVTRQSLPPCPADRRRNMATSKSSRSRSWTSGSAGLRRPVTARSPGSSCVALWRICGVQRDGLESALAQASTGIMQSSCLGPSRASSSPLAGWPHNHQEGNYRSCNNNTDWPSPKSPEEALESFIVSNIDGRRWTGKANAFFHRSTWKWQIVYNRDPHGWQLPL